MGETRPDDIVSLLSGWFGSGTGVAACFVDGIRPMLPEEENCVRAAVAKRREEFSAGRWCAHQALETVGAPQTPILIGTRHEPLWPTGFRGAITHAAGMAAAVASRSRQGIGIDLLEIAASELALSEAEAIICAPDELEIPRGRLFSAKESAVKAISPRIDRYLDFTEVLTRFDGEMFRAECAGFAVNGWWAERDGLVLTGAVISSAV